MQIIAICHDVVLPVPCDNLFFSFVCYTPTLSQLSSFTRPKIPGKAIF